jgi:hypothetical protein
MLTSVSCFLYFSPDFEQCRLGRLMTMPVDWDSIQLTCAGPLDTADGMTDWRWAGGCATEERVETKATADARRLGLSMTVGSVGGTLVVLLAGRQGKPAAGDVSMVCMMTDAVADGC